MSRSSSRKRTKTTRRNRILVTGSTGQIGSELTVALRRRYGNENVTACWYRRRPDQHLREGPYEHLDVTDLGALKRSLKRNDVDTVYHLAAVLSAVGEKNPDLAWKVNLDGLRNVLNAASELGLRVFWPSSMAVFGEGAPRTNTPQDAILIPGTIYGTAKVAGELLCKYYHDRFGLDVRSVRYPGIISSKTLPGGGTTDYAVQIFYEAIRKRHYTCFLRGDTVLPMMYMPDCIKAAVDLMESDSAKIRYRMGYNVTGMSFSAGELADEIGKRIPDFECEYKPDFRQRIADSWPRSLDDSLARREWGWKPDYDLPAMTNDMINELSKRLSKQKNKK